MMTTQACVYLMLSAMVCIHLVIAGDMSQMVGSSADGCPRLCSCAAGHVDCSYRGIQRLPRIFPRATLSVDLRGNNISEVGERAFIGIPGVNVINLDHCGIRKLSKFAFSGLQNISSIYLRFNNLSRIEQNTFNGVRGQCENVTGSNCDIDLSNNPIQSVAGRAFNNTRRMSVYFGNSRVTLNVHSSAFSGFENGEILSFTNVSEIVFLSSLAFKGMKNVRTIFFGHSWVQRLRPRMFYGATGLGEIIFQACELSRIESRAFSGVHFSLEKDCQESELDSYESFDDMVSSGRIEFRDSVIESLPYKMFDGCNVGAITVFGNDINRVANGAFRGLTELCHLKLSRNNIPSLTSGFFSGLENVNMIQVLNNRFAAIESGAFSHVTHVRRVVIAMKDVPTTVTVEREAFRGMKHVGVLHFHDINVNFHPFAFSGVSDLGVLNIERLNERTNVTKLLKNTFNGLEVKKLHLHSSGHFEPVKGVFDVLVVKEVRLEFKQLNCGCEAGVMARVLKNVAATYYVYCRKQVSTGPLLTKDTEIQMLDFDDCEQFEGQTSSGIMTRYHVQAILLLAMFSVLFLLR